MGILIWKEKKKIKTLPRQTTGINDLIHGGEGGGEGEISRPF